MKARLVPVSVVTSFTEAFRDQVGRIGGLLADEAEILPPVRMGDPLPDSDAVILPQLSGDLSLTRAVCRALALKWDRKTLVLMLMNDPRTRSFEQAKRLIDTLLAQPWNVEAAAHYR